VLILLRLTASARFPQRRQKSETFERNGSLRHRATENELRDRYDCSLERFCDDR
jgi:hypothetical protein